MAQNDWRQFQTFKCIKYLSKQNEKTSNIEENLHTHENEIHLIEITSMRNKKGTTKVMITEKKLKNLSIYDRNRRFMKQLSKMDYLITSKLAKHSKYYLLAIYQKHNDRPLFVHFDHMHKDKTIPFHCHCARQFSINIYQGDG